MAKLILEEGGKRRRFRLNEGKLTIGSGEAATLTLESDDVAEVHAELEFRNGQATLTPRKGVAPMSMQGRPVRGATELSPGRKVVIGGASLWVELEEGEAPVLVEEERTAPARRPSRATAGASRGAPSGGARKSARAGAGRRAQGTRVANRVSAQAAPAEDDEGPRVHRTKARGRDKQLPTWVPMLAIAAIAAVGFVLAKQWAGDVGSGEAFDEKTSLMRIRDSLDNGEFRTAAGEIAKAKRNDVSQAGLTTLAAYEKELANRDRTASEKVRNAYGDGYLQTQLKNYENSYLKGKSDIRAKARVFIHRARWFLREYPTHPETPWIERMVKRYEGPAAITEAPTLEDVTWEAHTYTWAKPRDYKAAFAALEGFRAGDISDDERSQVDALIAQHKSDRKTYFEEQLVSFKDDYEDGLTGKAVGTLVSLVTKIGDETMAEDAAGRIVNLHGYTQVNKKGQKVTMDVLPVFRGWRSEAPGKFARICESPTLKGFLKREGLVD